MDKLVVLIRRAAERLLSDAPRLAVALLIPTLILLVLQSPWMFAGAGYLVLLAIILSAWAHITIGVTVHRHVLLGSGSYASFGKLVFRRREWRFAGYSVALFLIAVGGWGLAAFLMVPLTVVLSGLEDASIVFVGAFFALFALATSWLIARFSLVLPAAAIDKPLQLGRSWELTAPHGALMTPVVIIGPLIGAAIGFLLVLPMPELVALVVETLVGVVINVLTIGLLSVAYEYVVGGVSAEPDAASPRLESGPPGRP